MAARKAGNAGENNPAGTDSVFSSEQLLSSERFRNRRDILNALLKPGEQYTVSAVEQLIENYMKGQVR
ncbi:MAG: hypothetical protein K2N94_06970 [Lachnospiraceae bacterium]|nr:hypothetical protein [Lachnospiraceae bacterium]